MGLSKGMLHCRHQTVTPHHRLASALPQNSKTTQSTPTAQCSPTKTKHDHRCAAPAAQATGQFTAAVAWATPPAWKALPESAQRIRGVWRNASMATDTEDVRCGHTPAATQQAQVVARAPVPKDPPPSRDPRPPPPPAAVPWLPVDDADGAWAGSLAGSDASAPARQAQPPAEGALPGPPANRPPRAAARPQPAASGTLQQAHGAAPPVRPPGLPPPPTPMPKVQTVLSKTPEMHPTPGHAPAINTPVIKHPQRPDAVTYAPLPDPPPAARPAVNTPRLNVPPPAPAPVLNTPQPWGARTKRQQERPRLTAHPPPDTVGHTAREMHAAAPGHGPKPGDRVAGGQAGAAHAQMPRTAPSPGPRRAPASPLPPPPAVGRPPAEGQARRRGAAAPAPGSGVRQPAAEGPRPRRSAHPPQTGEQQRTMNIGDIRGGVPVGAPAGAKRTAPGAAGAGGARELPVHAPVATAQPPPQKRAKPTGGESHATCSETVSDRPLARTTSGDAVSSGARAPALRTASC